MQGFDKKFKDFPDYILGITYEIWEQRGVETLNHYYAPDIIVRSPASVVVGNKTVIDATRKTLDEFPDRELLGEDVIWSGTPETGMLSSHRILSTATHVNDGAYGAATGKRVTYRVIADCHAKNNAIDDEWLIRDQSAILQQLGVDPKTWVAQQLVLDSESNTPVAPLTPENDVKGPYTGTGNQNVWGQKLADIIQQIVAGNPDVIANEYDRAAHLEYPGYLTLHGATQAQHFWSRLVSCFPNATFRIDHQIGREDETLPPRAAVRWSITGTHDGAGYFGEPTGAPVYLLGMTHAEFGSLHGNTASAKLRREYTLFDETAVWKQILSSH